MLKPAANGPAVVACNTCRLSDDARENEQGQRGGALLVEALRRVRASDPAYANVAVEEMPCLFACQSFCTVHLRCPGKVGYVMGKFTPMTTPHAPYWIMPAPMPTATGARCPTNSGRKG